MHACQSKQRIIAVQVVFSRRPATVPEVGDLQRSSEVAEPSFISHRPKQRKFQLKFFEIYKERWKTFKVPLRSSFDLFLLCSNMSFNYYHTVFLGT